VAEETTTPSFQLCRALDTALRLADHEQLHSIAAMLAEVMQLAGCPENIPIVNHG
jgi:hypothetical protein